MSEENQQKLELINRSKLQLEGVEKVLNYDDSEINLVTNRGKMIITGEKLDIEQLNIETSNLEVSGKVTKLQYDPGSRVKGFFRRLFK